MTSLDEIKELYAKYSDRVDALFAKARFADGLIGMGNDPKRDSCHSYFYDEIAEFIAKLDLQSLNGDELYEICRWILTATESYSNETTRLTMMACQGHAQALIPFLSPADAAKLLEKYDMVAPKRLRFPVQRQVAKLLKKQTKA